LIRLSGWWVKFYFKKIQNGVVLVQKEKKTKVNGLQPGFDRIFPGQPGCWVNPLVIQVIPGHDLSFFYQLSQIPAPGRPTGSGRVSKL